MLGKDFFEDASRLGAGARGFFGSFVGEVERMIKTSLESRLRKLRIVSREEFEAVKLLAENTRNELQVLQERLSEIEKKRDGNPKAPVKPKKLKNDK